MPIYKFEQHTLPNGITRVTTAVPDGSGPYPLVVSLHYGGPVSPWYGRGLLESVVVPAMGDFGAVFIAPDCAADRWRDPSGIAAVSEAMAWVSNTREIAPDIIPGRSVLVGYSKGGIGAWAIAEQLPELFSCAVVMAGAPPTEALTDERISRWTIPLHVIHAEQDELIPLGPTAAMAAHMQELGAPVTLTTLPGITHFETHRFANPLADAATQLVQHWRD
jgi:dienelactone hydrolase